MGRPVLKYDIDSNTFCDLVQDHCSARFAAGRILEDHLDLESIQTRMRDTYHNLRAYISEFVRECLEGKLVDAEDQERAKKLSTGQT